MRSSNTPGVANDRVRLAILGLGAVAQAVHLPLLDRLDTAFQIAAIADLSSSLVDQIGERYGVPLNRRHRSLHALLRVSGVDALVILTSGSHGPAILAGLDSGLAVFAEKPLAYTLAEADAIDARLAAEPRLRLQVGYMKLYDPAVSVALRTAADAALGPPRAIEITVLHPTSEAQLAHARLLPPPTDIPDAARAELLAASDALRVAALGREVAGALGRLYTDILLGSVVHELSLIRAFAGNPTSIDGLAVYPADRWPPSLELTGRLAADARFSIRWHFLPDYPAYREEVRVVYEAATTELSFPSPYLLHRPTGLRITTGQHGGHEDRIWSSTVEAFEKELLAFHALVVGGHPAASGVDAGRADIFTCQRAIAAHAASLGLAIGGEAAG